MRQVLVSALLIFVACKGADAPEPKPRSWHQSLLKKQGQSFEEALEIKLQHARRLQLKPHLEFTAEWCAPCVAFKRHMFGSLMQEAIAGSYIVSIDIDEWTDAMSRYQITGIPTWIELDDKGAPTGRRIDSGVWKEDIPTNMAPPLKRFFQGAAGAEVVNAD